MPKYCPNCKKEYESGKFCIECSSKLIDVVYRNYCPACNKVVESGKFCVDCGTPLISRKYVDDDPLDDLIGIKVDTPHNGPTDEEILSRYSDENGDLRRLNEEEAPLAIEEIKRLAERGIPQAEVLLADLYMGGEYMEEDWQKAYELVCDAETRGYAYAAEYIAVFYYFGIIVDRDIDKAEQLIDPFLEHTSTTMFLKGRICMDKGNEVESVKWISMSAKRDNPMGLLYMGYAYLNGIGNVPQDLVHAFECFSKSAALGNVEAENMLGVCYQNGEGTEPDEEQALYWYEEAVKHNDSNAQNNLANCYKNGLLGLDADPEKAFGLYKKAAEQDNVDAMFEVAEYYNANYLTAQKSVEWYQKAADAGHGDAMFELAQKYENGWNVEKDLAKAEELYAKAVEAGSELAIARKEHIASQEQELQSQLDKERKEKEQRELLEREQKEREEAAAQERRIKEAEAKTKAEAELKMAAERARQDAEAKALAAEQKQKELEAQIARQRAEEQERKMEEAKRKKRRRTFWILVLFLLLLGLIGYYSLFSNRQVYVGDEQVEVEETLPSNQSDAPRNSKEDAAVSNVTRSQLPSQTRFVGDLQSNDGKSYPIEMVLDYIPSSENGVLASVSGYYFYRKYKETNNIKLSGTVNSSRGLSLRSAGGSEEFTGTIDSDFQEFNGTWNQIKNGSVASTMRFSLSITK